jgi:hypothetical protein
MEIIMDELIVRECSWCGEFLGIAFHKPEKPSKNGYLHTNGICNRCSEEQLRISKAVIRIETGFYDREHVIEETAARMIAALQRGRNDDLPNQAG